MLTATKPCECVKTDRLKITPWTCPMCCGTEWTTLGKLKLALRELPCVWKVVESECTCIRSPAVALNGVHVYSCFSILPFDCLLVARVGLRNKILMQLLGDTGVSFLIASDSSQCRCGGMTACNTRDTTHIWLKLHNRQATAEDQEYVPSGVTCLPHHAHTPRHATPRHATPHSLPPPLPPFPTQPQRLVAQRLHS